MKKQAFSMVELLLTIAIIGIVSAMGLTISKKTTEQAFDLYYYQGFINLYYALAECYSTDNCNSATERTNYLNKLLGQNDLLINASIIAKNGISYQVKNECTEFNMKVPKTKEKKQNGIDIVIRDELLIPKHPANTANDPDLLKRRDLLPAYIDDGFVGRRTSATGKIDRIKYYSYEEVLCRITNGGTDKTLGDITDIISCATVPNWTSVKPTEGVIKFGKPSRIR